MNQNHSPLLQATILSLYPEVFPGPLGISLAGQALEHNIWSYQLINIRDFGLTKHKSFDDQPYGGGQGLVMRPDVLGEAIDYAQNLLRVNNIYYFSPRGHKITQKLVNDISKQGRIMLICGRFEGIDERVIEEYNITELSIGDFVLAGGEIAALALLDSCIRLLPGVIENQDSLIEESFGKFGEVNGILEYPLYTRPAKWRERQVPPILLSGNHKAITKWRITEAMKLTKQRRPDLIKDQKEE